MEQHGAENRLAGAMTMMENGMRMSAPALRENA
jgi:hypothetical protein